MRIICFATEEMVRRSATFFGKPSHIKKKLPIWERHAGHIRQSWAGSTEVLQTAAGKLFKVFEESGQGSANA